MPRTVSNAVDLAHNPEQLRAYVGIVAPILHGTQNVLVLDDDEDILQMLISYLRLCPIFNVAGASSVVQAEHLWSSQGWHCLLSDLYVPGQEDGMKFIAAHAISVPTIVLSGQSTGGAGFRCGQFGAVDFIDKVAIRADPLIARVYELSLRKRLCPRHVSPGQDATCDELLNGLFANAPLHTEQWAEAVGVTRRRLEQLLTECGSPGPNRVLEVFHLYKMAFRLYLKGSDKGFQPDPAELAPLWYFAPRPSQLRKILE